MARRMTWAHRPSKEQKTKVPVGIKAQIQNTANKFIDLELKPDFIKPPSPGSDFNYIVDIYSKWHGAYLYLCSKYRCPAENRIVEFFEERFARLEYVDEDLFNLSYKRHTGQWWELHRRLRLAQCFRAIKDDSNFQP